MRLESRLTRKWPATARALWRIVISRLSHDPNTRRYVQRRLTEGKTKTEAIRCLKRYVARELYYRLPQEPVA
jgi:transposase